MKRVEYEFDGYVLAFVPDDEGRIWIAPFTYMTLDTLIESFPKGTEIRITTEVAIPSSLAGELCDNDR